jgi:hypothetical protein
MLSQDYEGFRKITETTKNDKIFQQKIRWKLNEAAEPNLDIVPGFPVNKITKYSRELMIKAIQNGMIIQLNYKGDDDDSKGGERTIYPMNLGINKNTQNELIRAWHLEGYSYSGGPSTKKVWRLFKVTNIITMMFTGQFYRLPPAGYKMQDRALSERTIQRADFNQIRRNQNTLIQAGKVEAQEDTKIGSQKQATVNSIEVTNSGTVLDLRNPYTSNLIDKKNIKSVRITILKSIFGNDYMAIIGASSEKGKTVKVFEGPNKQIGTYKTVISFTGDEFNKNRNIEGKNEFDLWIFNKKK